MGLLALWQVTVLLLAVRTPGGPQQWLLDVALPWLLVPNDLAWMLCLWPLWWQAWPRRRAATRWLGIGLLVLQVVAMAVLQSRLAVLCVFGLIIGAVFERTARSRMHPWSRWMMVGLAGGVLVAAVFAIGKGVASLQARWQLWQAAFELWWSHPWFGSGPHGFGLAYRDVIATELVDPRHTPWPHQLPLELLANTGLVGFAGLCVVVAIVAIRVHSLRNTGQMRPGLAAALLGFAAVSMLEASTLRLWWWVVLAVLLASCKPDPTRHPD